MSTLIIYQVHEVLIQNTDKGSVITWDFDVMRHDVMFCVFRTKEAFRFSTTRWGILWSDSPHF